MVDASGSRVGIVGEINALSSGWCGAPEFEGRRKLEHLDMVLADGCGAPEFEGRRKLHGAHRALVERCGAPGFEGRRRQLFHHHHQDGRGAPELEGRRRMACICARSINSSHTRMVGLATRSHEKVRRHKGGFPGGRASSPHELSRAFGPLRARSPNTQKPLERIFTANRMSNSVSPNMQPFIVTFRFSTMPILHGACTLDAVLGGEIARGVDDLEEAIRMTPLARTDGIFHGSSLILQDDTGVTRMVPVVQKSPSAFWEIDPERTSRGRRRVDRPWAGGEEPPPPLRSPGVRRWRLAGNGSDRRSLGAAVLGPRHRQAPSIRLGG